MHRKPRKPVLTLEQKQQKKRTDGNVLQILRRVQARDQANQAACVLRVDFWTAVGYIAKDKAEKETEMRRIEEELEKKRKATQERKRHEALRIMADQAKSEADLINDRKRLAKEYAKRTKERFLIAVREERRQRSMNDAAVPEKTRKMESENERVRAVDFREANAPVAKHVSLLRRDSMVPRSAIPQPTSFSQTDVDRPSLLPFSSCNRSSFGNVSSMPDKLPVISSRTKIPLGPRPLKSKENILSEKEKANCQKKESEISLKKTENLEFVDVETENVTVGVASFGSFIDLGKENVKPLSSAFSPLSSSAASVVSLAGKRMVALASGAASSENNSVAISVQSSSLVSSNDSDRTQDSETLRSIFQNPAVQLSPPKHPPNPHRPLKADSFAGLPDFRGCDINGSLTENLYMKPLRGQETLGPPGGNCGGEPPGVPNPANLLDDLEEVMRALEMLDANLTGADLNSFTLSMSSGPLSIPDAGVLGSDESWISHQTMSSESSFHNYTHHNTTLESGTLFSSMSSSSRGADSGDVTMETGPMDFSFLQWKNVSGMRNDNLDDRFFDCHADFC